MVWYFIGVYIINRTLHGRLEIRNFSSRVENISRVSAANEWNIFQHEKRNFVSAMQYPLFLLTFWEVIGMFHSVPTVWILTISVTQLLQFSLRQTLLVRQLLPSLTWVLIFFYSSILFWPTCKVGTSSLTGVKFTLANRLSANALTWCARKMGEW